MPKGFTPNRKLGGGYNSGGMGNYPIANGYASNIGEGDPVKLSGGTIQLAENTTETLGIFAGCKYVDPDTAQLRVRKDFPANTSSKGGVKVEGSTYSQPIALVAEGVDRTFTMQTTEVSVSSLSAGIIGKSYAVSAIGSVLNGRSQAVVDIAASAGTTAGHMVTIVGLYKEPDVEFGVTPLAVEVKLSNPGIVGEL